MPGKFKKEIHAANYKPANMPLLQENSNSKSSLEFMKSDADATKIVFHPAL
jgi:hypothetical protein